MVKTRVSRNLNHLPRLCSFLGVIVYHMNLGLSGLKAHAVNILSKRLQSIPLNGFDNLSLFVLYKI